MYACIAYYIPYSMRLANALECLVAINDCCSRLSVCAKHHRKCRFQNPPLSLPDNCEHRSQHICAYMYVFIYVHIYIYICTYAYLYIYIYISHCVLPIAICMGHLGVSKFRSPAQFRSGTHVVPLRTSTFHSVCQQGIGSGQYIYTYIYIYIYKMMIHVFIFIYMNIY